MVKQKVKRTAEISFRPQFRPAVLLIMIVLLYAYPVVSGGHFLPLFDRRELGEIMQLAFLVLAAGLFLVFPIIAPVKAGVGNILRWVLFCGFAIIFGKLVYAQYGPGGVFAFAVLLYATFGGAMLTEGSRPTTGGYRFFAVFARWLICMIVMFSLVVAFDMGGHISRWYQHEKVIAAGFLYFLALSMAELMLYPALKRLG